MATTASTNNTTTIITAVQSIVYLKDSEKIVFTLGLVLLSVFTLLGNALVVTAFFTYRPLRTFTNYFIISLVIADLLVGVICMPVWVVVILTDYDHRLLIQFKVTF